MRLRSSVTRIFGHAVLALIAFATLVPVQALAQPGDLDLSFGDAGIVTTAIGSTSHCERGDYIDDLALLQGGGILAAGGSDGGIALVRYASTGELDPSFGEGSSGSVNTVNCGDESPESPIVSVAIQDHSIIALGGEFGLSRYGLNGERDSSFWPLGSFDLGESGAGVIVTQDGGIVIAGTSEGIAEAPLFEDFLADGQRDKSFGLNGRAQVRPPFGRSTAITSVALQQDGSVLAGGSASTRHHGNQIYVVRLKPNGIRDRRFGPDHNGVARVSVGEYSTVTALAVQGNGRIIAVGDDVADRRRDRLILARFLPNGRLDGTFGNRGTVLTKIPGGRASDVVIDRGRIWVTGSIAPRGQREHILLASYQQDGRLDQRFGRHGMVATLIGRASSGAAVAVQPDGGVLVGGSALVGTHLRFALVRYLSN